MPEPRLVALLGSYVVLSTTALMLIRSTLDVHRSPHESLTRSLLSPALVLGGFLYATSFCVWLLALRHYPPTTVYPLFVGVGFVGVALGSWLVLGESLGPTRIVGAGVVLAGIVMITR
jgi:multidrug transporter EmrE-like cation transporter